MTYDEANLQQALKHGYMTPGLLKEALEEFRREKGYLPRVIVTHMSPPCESAIRKELESVKFALDIEIVVSEADMTSNL